MNFYRQLQRNLGDYLARPTVVRPYLRQTINNIVSLLPETVIFGGMIREFALGGARSFASDIDLVTMASQSEIYEAIKDHSPSVNKFGGYRLVVEKQRFDIWSFPNTWAFREGLVLGLTFDDLLKTTFFNLDAACFQVEIKKLTTIDTYQTDVENRVLGINLVKNPNPSGVAKRAIAMVINHRLGMTHELIEFTLQNLKPETLTWFEARLMADAKKHLLLSESQGGDGSVFRFDLQAELST